jgi:hypothetical protein
LDPTQKGDAQSWDEDAPATYAVHFEGAATVPGLQLERAISFSAHPVEAS